MVTMRAVVPAALCLLAIPVSARAPSETLLRLKLGKGDTLHYAMVTRATANSNGDETSMDQKLTSVMEVTEKDQGTITVVSSSKEITVEGDTIDGNAIADQIARAKVTFRFDELGRVKNAETSGLEPGPQAAIEAVTSMGTGFVGMMYPEGAVRVGSRWAGSLDLAPTLEASSQGTIGTGQDIKLPVNYSVTGIDIVNGRTVLRVLMIASRDFDLKLNAPGSGLDSAKFGMRMTATYDVDADSGVPTRYASDVAMTMKIQDFSFKFFARQNAKLTSPLPGAAR
jgi:hypothetical protein